MSRVLVCTVKRIWALAGPSSRQSQQKIKILIGINDPIAFDLINILNWRCKYKNRKSLEQKA
jgi:hypothetical protein